MTATTICWWVNLDTESDSFFRNEGRFEEQLSRGGTSPLLVATVQWPDGVRERFGPFEADRIV